MRHVHCVLILLTVSCLACGSDPEGVLEGRWRSSTSETFEFTPDGKVTVDKTLGSWTVADDRKRLFIEVSTGFGATRLAYNILELNDDDILLADDEGKVLILLRIDAEDDSKFRTEYAGTWKIDTRKPGDEGPEGALYWRLGKPDDISENWVARDGELSVAYGNGLIWRATVDGDELTGNVRYSSGKTEPFSGKRVSTDLNHPVSVWWACYSGQNRVLTCRDIEKEGRCSASTGPSFARESDCVIHCKEQAAESGGTCASDPLFNVAGDWYDGGPDCMRIRRMEAANVFEVAVGYCEAGQPDFARATATSSGDELRSDKTGLRIRVIDADTLEASYTDQGNRTENNRFKRQRLNW